MSDRAAASSRDAGRLKRVSAGARLIDRAITGAHSAEEAAKRYACLFESRLAGLMVADTSGNITEANDAFLDMVGYDRSELPLSWRAITPLEWRHIDEQKIREAVQTGAVVPFEKEYLRKDGGRVPILVGAASLNEAADAYFCIVLDLTDQKRVEAALRQSEVRHRGLIDAIPDAIFRLDPNGRYLDFKPAKGFEPILPPEDFLGASVHDVLPTDLASQTIRAIREALHTREPQRIEYTLDMGGEPRQFEARIVPNDQDSVFAVVRDVTEAKAAQLAVHESEARYRTLYDNIPLMYFTLDGNGTVVSVNTQGAEHLGYTQAELVGQPVLTVFHEDDRAAVQRQIQQVVSEPGRVARWEFRKVRKDGTVLWVRESVSTVVDTSNRALVLVVCEDITERKEVEKQLAAQRAQLEKLSTEVVLAEERERQQVARELHDNVGQLLALARGLLGAARRSGDVTEATLAESLRALDQAIEQMRSLTFELSSPVLHELGLPTALKSLAGQMARQGGFRSHFRGEPLRLPVTADMCFVVYRSVRELLMNVVKHAQADDVWVSVHQSNDGRVRVTVKDNGCGFDTTGLTEGFSKTGTFGLFSIRQQLEHMGGRFTIESEVEHGTRAVVEARVEE